MPMSLKCMINKWLHKNQISQEEYDAVIKKLEGHDKQIRADGTREFAEWLCASHIVTTPMGTRMWENDLIAEWQKGEDK